MTRVRGCIRRIWKSLSAGAALLLIFAVQACDSGPETARVGTTVGGPGGRDCPVLKGVARIALPLVRSETDDVCAKIIGFCRFDRSGTCDQTESFPPLALKRLRARPGTPIDVDVGHPANQLTLDLG